MSNLILSDRVDRQLCGRRALCTEKILGTQRRSICPVWESNPRTQGPDWREISPDHLRTRTLEKPGFSPGQARHSAGAAERDDELSYQYPLRICRAQIPAALVQMMAAPASLFLLPFFSFICFARCIGFHGFIRSLSNTMIQSSFLRSSFVCLTVAIWATRATPPGFRLSCR